MRTIITILFNIYLNHYACNENVSCLVRYSTMLYIKCLPVFNLKHAHIILDYSYELSVCNIHAVTVLLGVVLHTKTTTFPMW